MTEKCPISLRPIGSNSLIIQAIVWPRTGDKSIPKPTMTKFTDTYMRHQSRCSRLIHFCWHSQMLHAGENKDVISTVVHFSFPYSTANRHALDTRWYTCKRACQFEVTTLTVASVTNVQLTYWDILELRKGDACHHWFGKWFGAVHLNQCWDIVNWTIGNKLRWNCNRNPYIFVRRAGLLWSQQDFEWRWSVPLFKCLTVLEFSFILFDLCLLITFFNFIMNYVPIVPFWIFTYHKIWILSIMFCFIWSYWIIYFLACLEVSWRVVS